jgi:hypothetical protein
MKFSPSKFQYPTNLGAMLSVKRGLPLMRLLYKQLILMGRKVTPNWIRITLVFIRQIHCISQTEGLRGVVIYLKVHSVVLQQSIGGYRVDDLTPLGKRISRTKCGLPRSIPAYVRKLIRNGDTMYIRYYLTMYSLYRDIYVRPVLKLRTITDSFSGDNSVFRLFHQYTARFKSHFQVRMVDRYGRMLRPNPFLIYTASPNSKVNEFEFSTHTASLNRSSVALVRAGLYPTIQ